MVRWTASLACAVVLSALAWFSPQSPVALWRADARLAAGDVIGAVALYEQVAAAGLLKETRRAAVERVAAVLWSDRRAYDAAADWLLYLTAFTDDPVVRADVFERMASLVDVEDALVWLDGAGISDPARACDFQLEAARRAASEAANSDLAANYARERFLGIRRSCPQMAGVSWLREGNLLLELGELDEAENAFRGVDGDALLEQAAAQGIAVCATRRGETGDAAVADAQVHK